MKIVTICYGGNSRSVGMAHVLKYQFGHDVLTCSCQTNSDETRALLCQWADVVVVTSTEFLPYIRQEFIKKTVVAELGPDKWFLQNYIPKDLLDTCNYLWTQIMAGWEGPLPGA